MGLLLLILLPFVTLMFFAQPAIDDYDNAATVARLGRWGAQWYWYMHWSGRFVAIGLSTICNPLAWGERSGAAPAGLWALRSMLLVLIAGFMGALQLLLRTLLMLLPQLNPPANSLGLQAWGLTLAITALGLNALSEPFTMLYWYSGAVNYLFPLVLTILFAATGLRALYARPAEPALGWCSAATLSLAAACGSGEIALLACLVILVVQCGWLKISRASPRAWRLWALWLGVAVGMGLLMLAAPGNWQRLGMASPDAAGRYHRWIWLVPRTLLTAARMAARPPVLGALLLLAGSILLTAPESRRSRPQGKQILLVLGGYIAFNCVGVAFLKAAFMRDMWVEAMPARVVNVLVLQLLVSTVAVTLWLRPWLPVGLGWVRRPWVLPGALAAVLLSGQARWVWPELLLTAPDYATQMHARYQALASARRQGATQAALPPLRLAYAQGLLAPIPSARQRADVHTELFEDASQKNNLFLAHYYGLELVRLSSPPPQYGR